MHTVRAFAYSAKLDAAIILEPKITTSGLPSWTIEVSIHSETYVDVQIKPHSSVQSVSQDGEQALQMAYLQVL